MDEWQPEPAASYRTKVRPAFERAGYAVTHKREFAIAHEDREVPIHNWAMEKPL